MAELGAIDVDEFDPLFFNISPRDAATVDPRARLLLEVVWTLLEDIGCTRKRIDAGRVVAVSGDFSHESVAALLALFIRRCIAVPLPPHALDQNPRLLATA